MDADLYPVLSLLSPSEVIIPTSPRYVAESSTWAAQLNLKPRVVVRPESVESLSRLVAALNDSTLDFAVRSGGCGNASAKDILISMTAFDGFEYDLTADYETATFGAGQTWGTIDTKIEKHCPGFATISPRCDFLGAGGPIVYGGLGWMSSERGLICAPQNLLDALVVKADGKALWAAKEDPDLLWAIRGGGGSFAILVQVKTRIWRYNNSVFAGRVIFPKSSLPLVAKEVADFSKRVTDPKMALHLYGLNMESYIDESGKMDVGNLVLFLYDANGEEHARSQEGYEWALRIPGAKAELASMPVSYVNALFANFVAHKGKADSWMSAPLVSDITDDFIMRAWKWFDDLTHAQPRVIDIPLGAFVLIEIMQKAAIHSESPRTDCAWPHSRQQHVLQLGVAASPDDQEMREQVVKALQDAPEQIDPGHRPGDYLPNFVQPWNNVAAIYGVNFEKLKQIKKRVDPKGKFGGPFV